MTIEFPKLPNDRRRPKRAINSETNPNFTPATPTEPLPNENASSQPPEVEISATELNKLKTRLKAKKKSKAKMNKYLPLVAGLLVIIGLGIFAYPLLQNIWGEKTPAPVATATKSTAVKTTTSSTATTAPIMVSSAPVETTPVAPMAQATLTNETVTNTATPNQISEEDDLQRPVLVDNVSPTNNPVPSAKPELTENKATDDQNIPTKPDNLKPSSQEVVVAPVPKNTQNMSYDEFVKTSDTAVFIEPATTNKK